MRRRCGVTFCGRDCRVGLRRARPGFRESRERGSTKRNAGSRGAVETRCQDESRESKRGEGEAGPFLFMYGNLALAALCPRKSLTSSGNGAGTHWEFGAQEGLCQRGSRSEATGSATSASRLRRLMQLMT